MDMIRELTLMTMLLRMLLAVVLGAVLGVERGLQNRPAGLRTYILVSLGSCIVMITNQYVYQAFNTGDPVRMAAQVVSGIGFLGAGTIIVTKRNQIKGLTTAAGLWASACVGLAIGIGLYEVALVGGLTIFVVLWLLNYWDFYIKARHNIDAYVELKNDAHLGQFIKAMKTRSIKAGSLQFESDGKGGGSIFLVTLEGRRENILKALEEVDCISWYETF